MIKIFVRSFAGSSVVDAEVQLTDTVKSLRSIVEESLGGLPCRLIEPGGTTLIDDSLIEIVVGTYGDQMTVVIDGKSPEGRYRSASLALDALTVQDWETISAVPLDDTDYPPESYDTIAELICRTLGLRAERTLDKEEEDEGRMRDDYWGTLCKHVFPNPSCITAALPANGMPVPPAVIERVERFSVIFEFIEQALAKKMGTEDDHEAEHGDEDEGDDEEEGDEDGEEEEDGPEPDKARPQIDFNVIYAGHPPAIGCLSEWVFAVRELVHEGK